MSLGPLFRNLHRALESTISTQKIISNPLINKPSYELTCQISVGIRSCSQSHSPARLPYTQHPLTRQSGIGLSVITFIFCGCLLSGSILSYRNFWFQFYPTAAEELRKPAQATPSCAMVATLPPGRPGNLTVEQEKKLQEFWKATLKVFGVPDLGGLDAGGSVNGIVNGENEDNPSEHGSSLVLEKKLKKKGLFRRRKGDSGDKDDVSIQSNTPEADDKFGQTKEFHQALATQSPQDLREAFWSMVKHDHPDGLLLRFLRARKWDVEKALVMMVSTMQWRSHDMHVDDDIMYNGEAAAYKDAIESTGPTKKEGEDFMKIMRLGKSFLHGCDKEGRPICIVRARLHRAGEQSEGSLERVTVHIIETARLLLSPPVDSAVSLQLHRILYVIMNVADHRIRHDRVFNGEHGNKSVLVYSIVAEFLKDYAPVKFMIKCFEANYPESLGVVLVHKSPWVFQGKPLASSFSFHPPKSGLSRHLDHHQRLAGSRRC